MTIEWLVPASYVTESPNDIFLVLDPSQCLIFLVGAVNILFPSSLLAFVRGRCMTTSIRIIQSSASLILLIKITINMQILHVRVHICGLLSMPNSISKNGVNGDYFLCRLRFTHDE